MSIGRGADCGDRQGMTRPLWQLSATELVDGYRTDRFTPVDALLSVFDRCKDINPTLNAIVTLAYDSALTSAERSTQRWKDRQPLGALDGVPISIKDNLLVKGMRTTWGSRAFAEFIPDHDEVPVARLRDRGLVIFGKANVPELTLQGYTDNLLFGATGNPHAPDLTPGGSSGGAVAAVGSGMGPLALCTDGGGSIRRPAAHGGLYGLKPSARTVRRGKGFPAILGEFEVVGPLARTLEDITLLFAELAETELPEAKLSGTRRILYARTFANQPVDPEIAAGIDATAQRFSENGCEVTTVESLDCLAGMDEIWPIVSTSGVAWLFDQYPDLEDMAAPDLQSMAEAGRRFTAKDYAGAIAGIERIKDLFLQELDGFDALLTPAIAALSWPKAESHPKTIAGQPVGPRGHAIFTAFANALGLPGLSVPAGMSRQGLPYGFQLVGPYQSENRLIDIARRSSCQASE